MNEAHQEKDNAINTPKRQYSTPTLTTYGPVSKLTQSGNGSGADGGTQSGMMMPCL